MNTIEVMKQALEALEDANGISFDDGYGGLDYSTQIADLRAVIAELENAQPKAWKMIGYTDVFSSDWYAVSLNPKCWTPLYTHPATTTSPLWKKPSGRPSARR